VSVRTSVAGGPVAGFASALCTGALLPVTGGERLALRMSVRARGLRGLDVLRRSQDRAPPRLR
jgi:hypothetical protein